MGVEGATSPLNDHGPVLLVITRLLLVRSVRKKYGRRGHDGPFPLTLVRFSRLLLVRPVRRKYGRRGRDEPFKRPRSGSPRCYSFGEKNS
ncbi:hypothetical protein V1477_006326 [Vespula maculifrons]|uniref:Uncharacterized protein n=1 Tax=Vespula maculifrons TaxID=7453 RepID=A0ABD2CKD3_VESMC